MLVMIQILPSTSLRPLGATVAQIRKLTLLQRVGVAVAVMLEASLWGDLKAADRPGEAVDMFLPVLRRVLEALRRGERRVAMRGKVLGVLGRPCGSLRGEVRLEIGPGVWLIPKTAELRMFSRLLRR